jgi:hypothetical protein
VKNSVVTLTKAAVVLPAVTFIPPPGSSARHHVHALGDDVLDVVEELHHLRIALEVGHRIVVAGDHALAEEDLDPAFIAEQLVVLAEEASVRSK